MITLRYFQHRWYIPLILSRSPKWQNLYCSECNSISHYPQDGVRAYDYSSGDYRHNGKAYSPPISLPWSAVTYERSNHVSAIVKRHLNHTRQAGTLSILDYGGYTGLLAYGVGQRIGTSNITVADFDANGLRVAQSIGCIPLDLANRSAPANKFDIILLVHVLEHVEDPRSLLSQLRSFLSDDKSLLYVEVPNLFGFAHNDEAHLTEFSRNSLNTLAISQGFEILEMGNVSSPTIVDRLGYPYRCSSENIFMVLAKGPFESSRASMVSARAGQGLHNISTILVLSQIRYSANLIFNLLKLMLLAALKFTYSVLIIIPSVVATSVVVCTSLPIWDPFLRYVRIRKPH